MTDRNSKKQIQVPILGHIPSIQNPQSTQKVRITKIVILTLIVTFTQIVIPFLASRKWTLIKNQEIFIMVINYIHMGTCSQSWIRDGIFSGLGIPSEKSRKSQNLRDRDLFFWVSGFLSREFLSTGFGIFFTLGIFIPGISSKFESFSGFFTFGISRGFFYIPTKSKLCLQRPNSKSHLIYYISW